MIRPAAASRPRQGVGLADLQMLHGVDVHVSRLISNYWPWRPFRIQDLGGGHPRPFAGPAAALPRHPIPWPPALDLGDKLRFGVGLPLYFGHLVVARADDLVVGAMAGHAAAVIGELAAAALSLIGTGVGGACRRCRPAPVRPTVLLARLP